MGHASRDPQLQERRGADPTWGLWCLFCVFVFFFCVCVCFCFFFRDPSPRQTKTNAVFPWVPPSQKKMWFSLGGLPQSPHIPPKKRCSFGFSFGLSFKPTHPQNLPPNDGLRGTTLKSIWVWLKVKPLGLRRVWSMCPLTRATHFGPSFLSHSHVCVIYFSRANFPDHKHT